MIKKEWEPIIRTSRTIPFGYREDDHNPYLLLPVENELIALEKAKRYLRQYSSREVAQWLTEATGREISHMGLRKRIRNDRSKQNKKRYLDFWTKKFEEARLTIQAIHERDEQESRLRKDIE
jgi:hypothetical protein